ncbi:dTMP kinase [Sinobaca sp. H24]|uniref:dTMP kinase n=1 Tax=Sinobaca sp. H24 TaxID=2923376 RepID=UPI00207AA977|nr:dTMP kinase [Sinobaca sp. H24]
MTHKGWFITLEGGEGSGKTTAMHELEQFLKQTGKEVVTTREPGGVAIAEKIRALILDPDHQEMDARTEALLYAAARRQHLVEVVLPALKQGCVVLCDRFVDSSLAYQGAARGLGIDAVYQVNAFAIEDCMPDLTLFFDISPENGMARILENQNREFNRLDGEAMPFHHSVHQAYHQLLERFPERMERVDADQSKEEVIEEAVRIIQVRLLDKG